MKPATLLALPALALAAATPAKVEERQLGFPLPALPLDIDCLLEVTDIATCIDIANPPSLLTGLVGCTVVIIGRALSCIDLGLPVKN